MALSKQESALYDRQIRLWGVAAQQRMRESKILIVGMTALAAELCKNIVLAGLNVVILDDHVVQRPDVEAHLFLRMIDIGKPRAAASLQRLQELNPFASVKICNANTTMDAAFIKNFHVVCMLDRPEAEQIKINEICHSEGVAFFAADCFGLHASFFIDLNKHSYVKTKAGGHVDKDAPVLTCIFPSLRESTSVAWGEIQKSRRRGVVPSFYAMQALKQFEVEGTVMQDLWTRWQTLRKGRGLPDGIVTPSLLRALGQCGRAHLSPVCAVMGGLIGQEVVKAVTGHNAPSDNWIIFDGTSGSAVVVRIAPTKAKVSAPAAGANVMDLIDLDD